MLFSNFVGQDEIKQYLIKSIKENSISHGYIFEGPSGIGKMQLAVLFAKALLCENFEGEPCDHCAACIKVNTYNHPDLHIISENDKSIKRDAVDEIIESISKKPYEADKKIYIINNVQEMTLQAANTFLKTLEEPDGNTVIILITTNINKLLPTVVSRCQVLKFKSIDKKKLVTYIKQQYNLDDDKALLIAYYSHGILNKAVNIIEGKDNILEERANIIKIFDKIIHSGKEIIFEYENYFESEKVNIEQIVEILMIWLRDILFVKNGVYSLVINRDYMEQLKEHSSRINTSNIDMMIVYLQDVLYNVGNNVNYKLIIDKMINRLQEEVIR